MVTWSIRLDSIRNFWTRTHHYQNFEKPMRTYELLVRLGSMPFLDRLGLENYSDFLSLLLFFPLSFSFFLSLSFADTLLVILVVELVELP